METFETGNINSKWLENVYENLKNLENLERMAREGCLSLIDYVQIQPKNKQSFFTDVQYKNARMIVGEMRLLLTDLVPIIKQESHISFMKTLQELERAIYTRELFVVDNWSVTTNTITHSRLTPFFFQTMDFLSDLKLKIIREIAHILYVDKSMDGVKKW